MGIRAFFRRHWNRLTDKIYQRLDEDADKIDDSLNTHYPLSTRFFRRLGLTPQTVLQEARVGSHYLVDKTKDLLNGVRNAGNGFLDVVATFIPFLPNRTSIWWAMGHKTLRKDFTRAAVRDGFFVILGTTLFKWPEIVYQYFIRKKEEREEPFGMGFYPLFLLNMALIYKFIKLRRMVSEFKHFLIEDILDTAVVNDKTSKLMVKHLLTDDVKRLSKKSIANVLDPRPKAIKELIRTKIFATLESTIKDYFMLAVLAFNQTVIGSKFIAVSGWFVRARILGKDLGTTQLAATGLSNVHMRRIQGHRNFQFMGEGIAYLGLDELGRAVFFLMTGLNNSSLFNFPINVGLSCLAYKISILSTYMKKMEIRETDWNQEGLNLDTFYRPITIDPVLNWSASRIKRRFQNNADIDVNDGDVKSKKEDQSAKAQLKEKEMQFWDKLMKKRLSKAEREFLQLHAENLIFFLSAFKQSRATGGEYCIKFLALLFPKPIQDIMKVGLDELSDDRIDSMITFLLINKKNNLSLDGKMKKNDTWVDVKDKRLKPKNTQPPYPIYEDELEEIELFDITPKEIAAIHDAVAKTLECHNSGIIDIRAISEHDHPEEVFHAEVQHQYDSITDVETEARDTISPIQSTKDILIETFSMPVRQFLHNYRIAREAGVSRTRFIVNGVSEGVSAMSHQIDNNIPGGKTTLKVAGMASSVVGGPVTTVIGITAVVAHTVADNAPSIQAGAAMMGNLMDGLNSAKEENKDRNEQKENKESDSIEGVGLGLVQPTETRAAIAPTIALMAPIVQETSTTTALEEAEIEPGAEKSGILPKTANPEGTAAPYVHQFRDYIYETASSYWGKVWRTAPPLEKETLKKLN